MKRWKVTGAIPLLCIACGARSDLYLPAPRDASITQDAAQDAGHDGPAPDATVPEDASVIPTGCTSALEPGSPAPIMGYCSSQAHVAPTRVPSSPKAKWAIQLDADTAPSEMVIDRDGRIYVASCSAEEGWVQCKQLVSLLPDGAIAWSKTFDGHVRGLYLDAMGTLHAEFGNPRTLVEVDVEGTVTQLGQLPENVWYDWVGSDGDLYGSWIEYGGTQLDRLVKMTPSGEILWSTALSCSECIATTALSPNDEMVAGLVSAENGDLAGSIVRLDNEGHERWTLQLPGFPAEPIAIANDGAIRVALWLNYQQTNTSLALASIDAAGEIRWLVDTQQDPQQTSQHSLVVLNDGTTVFRSFTHLNAVDGSGKLLWSNELSCPNCTYSAGADPDGGLVVLAPGIEGLDAKTGAVLWSGIEPPQDGSTFYFGSMMVLGPPGVVYGATYGGVVFAASDG